MSDGHDPTATLVTDMARLIARFERGDLSLDRLSSGLKVRLAALANYADTAWVEALRTERNQLDLVTAVTDRAGRTVLTDTEQREVDDAVRQLKRLLAAPV